MAPDASRPRRARRRPGAWILAVIALAAAGIAAPTPAETATAQPLVRCARSPGGTLLLSRPSACIIFGPGGSFAGGVNLDHLRWASWGGAVAVATGNERGFHLPLEHIEVSVTLSGARSCGGRRLYTRAQVTSGNGTTVAHPFGCVVATSFSSPSGKILCQTGAAFRDSSLVVFCQERGTDPYFAATISVAGQVRRVANNGDPGDAHFSTVAYGRTVSAPGVRCTSLAAGMRCVGTRTGHGFLIRLAGVQIF
jgi:hypothetical protein